MMVRGGLRALFPYNRGKSIHTLIHLAIVYYIHPNRDRNKGEVKHDNQGGVAMAVYGGVRQVRKEEMTAVMEVYMVSCYGRNRVPNEEDNPVIG
ncbi:hypothetical protein L1987_78478 [Smallanthus sonchifolius]|uniref:Uncharacterized protein n=1 Tax=Smallanthus sonchifolius TaxID=185202 RepID=A0ACB8ZCL9_9ASTR|nr:hypothetical protein L1987_78478 [Smallanthus sonchifolius]